MRKLAIYFLVCVLIGLVGFLGFKYFHPGNIPAETGSTVIKNASAGSMNEPSSKTNPRIEPILETAQSVNVDSYTPEQARLRDFFQSGSTMPARNEQASVPGK